MLVGSIHSRLALVSLDGLTIDEVRATVILDILNGPHPSLSLENEAKMKTKTINRHGS